MNKYILTEFLELENDSSLLTEDEKRMNDSGQELILAGRLQKADTKNGNGRIYPKKILQREVENYRKMVMEKRSLGELDHPSCVCGNTEILTSEGWKEIKDISNNEKIYTLNLNNKNIELQEITEKIISDYSGEMISFKSKNIEQILTPNHRILLQNRKKEYFYEEADKVFESIKENKNDIFHCMLTRAGNWESQDPEFYQVGEYKIKFDDWVSFMGIWFAEGHINGSKGGKVKSYRICVSQKKELEIELIRELLDKLPFNFKYSGHQFSVNNKSLWEELTKFGNSHTKYIPDYLKNSSKKSLNNLLDWMLLGDGLNRQNHKKTGILRELATTSKRLANDTSEIMFKIGYGGSISVRIPKDRMIEGREILAVNSKPIYIIHEHSVEGIYFSKTIEVKKIPWNDKVYCVKVPNQNWLMRYNGKTCWTGNSSVIELKNVSHLISYIEMRNDEVIGKLKILDTPAGKIAKDLIKGGVKLGVSSRGLGSTKDQNGDTIVQDDFQLICFDLVSEPSTTGAYLFKEHKEHKLFSKSDKIFRALNDILDEGN